VFEKNDLSRSKSCELKGAKTKKGWELKIFNQNFQNLKFFSLKKELKAYNGNGYKKTRKVTYYMNKLKCNHCGKVCHKE
jgi:hypothetical protein